LKNPTGRRKSRFGLLHRKNFPKENPVFLFLAAEVQLVEKGEISVKKKGKKSYFQGEKRDRADSIYPTIKGMLRDKSQGKSLKSIGKGE